MIAGLDDDARAELLALFYVGRGDMEPEEWGEAVRFAREREAAGEGAVQTLLGSPIAGRSPGGGTRRAGAQPRLAAGLTVANGRSPCPARLRRGATKALRVLTRPVRRAQGYGGKGRGGLVVEPYRGYGSRRRDLPDRPGLPAIARHPGGGSRIPAGAVARPAPPHRPAEGRGGRRDGPVRRGCRPGRDRSRRLFPRAPASARVPTGAGGDWHPVELRPRGRPADPRRGRGVHPARALPMRRGQRHRRHGDAHRRRQQAEDALAAVRGGCREPGRVPGVAALYRALHAGAGGDEGNPMLYVSRAPWGLYEMLSEFFQRHGIPAGPVLFLREWGLSWTHPLPRRATDHKQALIRHMLALYRDLPFVLIGDSGQHDPEVYAQIVEENPGRVLAVYIRNVSRNAGRVEEIVRLAGAVARAGSSLVLAADSVAMAEHAASIGLIAPDAVAGVADEHAADARDRAASGDRPDHPRARRDSTATRPKHRSRRRRSRRRWRVTAPCRRPWWSSRRSRRRCRDWNPERSAPIVAGAASAGWFVTRFVRLCIRRPCDKRIREGIRVGPRAGYARRRTVEFRLRAVGARSGAAR